MYFASSSELISLDKFAIQSGISIREMMTMAGWHVLGVFERLAWNSDKRVAVIVGNGHNGGDGLAAAKHLVNHGYSVSIILLERDLKPDSNYFLQQLRAMNVPIFYLSEGEHILANTDIIVDAMLGCGLQGAPRDAYAESIKLINKSKKFVLSYDIPSGMNCDNQNTSHEFIKATATLTLALPKKVFQNSDLVADCGRIFLADIGIPRFIYDHISPGSRPGFGGRGLVEL